MRQNQQAIEDAQQVLEAQMRKLEDMTSQAALEDYAEELSNTLVSTVDIMAASATAFFTFLGMWPTALAIAPAAIDAALRSKILLPQSSLPGLFVILLPLVTSPLVWSLYSMALEVGRSLVFWAACILLACYPLLYTIVGSARGIQRPMEDAEIVVIAGQIRKAAMAGKVGAICCLAAFFFNLWLQVKLQSTPNELTANVVHRLEEMTATAGQSLDPASIAYHASRIVISVISQYFVVAVAGTDWMMSKIGYERMYSKVAENAEKLGLTKDKAKSLQDKRDTNLNAVSILNGGRDERASASSWWHWR